MRYQSLQKLLQKSAKVCRLPWLLRAMARWTTVEEWRHAINMLQSYPSKFPGIGNDVVPSLKLSYDTLSYALKTCFQYCALFVEDHNVSENEVIELWIGEGLLDNFDNISAARDEGKSIIKSLKRACLLEKSDAPGILVKPEDLWKMHDVICDMALWLASEEGNNILVAKHNNLNKEKEVAKRKEAVSISLWGPKIEFHRELPDCPRLRTLLVKDTILKTFPDNFFQSMPQLQVLDLSYNLDLTELPVGIGELINLQYLNLSDTSIRKFPIEVKNLSRLRMLLLDDMYNLEAIPSGVISCFSSLQVFSRLFGGLNELHYHSFDDMTLLQELESLENISEIGVTLFTLESIIKFKSFPKLQTCFKGLTIKCSGLLSLDITCSIMRRMENVEILIIWDCDSLEELKICFGQEERVQGFMSDGFRNLHDVRILNCPMKDLTWLIYAPCLQYLLLDNCPSLEEIIAYDFGSSEIEEERTLGIFTKLRSMDFSFLPNLKSICREALPFVSLQSIFVTGCPNLRKLPFNSDSANINLNVIWGSTEWWEQLEWEDEAAKHVFASKFIASEI